jgi:hypothetical protein
VRTSPNASALNSGQRYRVARIGLER